MAQLNFDILARQRFGGSIILSYLCNRKNYRTSLTMSYANRERFHHDPTPKLNSGNGIGPLAILLVIALAVLYYLFT